MAKKLSCYPNCKEAGQEEEWRMRKRLLRFSASIERKHKKALESYAEKHGLNNQFGEPGINLALRHILDSHPDLIEIMHEENERV